MLSVGIVGLPNVGKSTLFNALTHKGVPAENFPFCTIDPSVGIVPVPDKRLEDLANLSVSKKIIPAAIEFIDIAGLVAGAHKGEGLGNKFLANIRECDSIIQLVRVFSDENIAHVSGKLDPISDVETIGLELVLSDLQTVTKKLQTLSREVKGNNADAIAEEKALTLIKDALEKGKLANTAQTSSKDVVALQGVHLLTLKPILYILNSKSSGTDLVKTRSIISYFNDNKLNFITLDARFEEEISHLPPVEQEVYRKEISGAKAGVDAMIVECFRMLNLITFFTTGPDETRGWQIKEGQTAPDAGAKIHSDFHDKFIRADVIAADDLIGAGSMSLAREKGLVKTVGKDYIICDGDVVEFRI